MKKEKRKIQILSLFMAVSMMLLSACGSEGKQTEEVAEVIADSDIADIEGEESETVEVQGEEEGKEEEAEEIEEEPLAVVPYAEENELGFSEDLTIPVKCVRVDINDNSVYEEVDGECVITDASIEDTEDGFKTITVKYEVTGEIYDSYEKRLLQANMPNAAYCDLNTGKFYDIDDGFSDSEETSEITVEWNDRTYEIAQTRVNEWSPEPDWKSDGKNGYVGPVTMYVTESFVVPEDYNSLGMAMGIFTTEETYSGEHEMFGDTPPFILEVLESREDARLYSINELCELFSEDEAVTDDADAKVNAGKSSAASSNNGNSKENTDNSSSNTPKQAQPVHTHSYTSSVTKNPSCGENGVMTYTCSCGDSYTEAIPASGHQWNTTTETVSHPSTGHYDTVTKKEIWCGCGASGFQSMDEYKAHVWNTRCGGSTCGVREWTENVWVVDSEGWTETINITKCAVCGAQG